MEPSSGLAAADLSRFCSRSHGLFRFRPCDRSPLASNMQASAHKAWKVDKHMINSIYPEERTNAVQLTWQTLVLQRGFDEEEGRGFGRPGSALSARLSSLVKVKGSGVATVVAPARKLCSASREGGRSPCLLKP